MKIQGGWDAYECQVVANIITARFYQHFLRLIVVRKQHNTVLTSPYLKHKKSEFECLAVETWIANYSHFSWDSSSALVGVKMRGEYTENTTYWHTLATQ